jgi:hypothetical protein
LGFGVWIHWRGISRVSARTQSSESSAKGDDTIEGDGESGKRIEGFVTGKPNPPSEVQLLWPRYFTLQSNSVERADDLPWFRDDSRVPQKPNPKIRLRKRTLNRDAQRCAESRGNRYVRFPERLHRVPTKLRGLRERLEFGCLVAELAPKSACFGAEFRFPRGQNLRS